jgi:large conductance mechanosensitive channel
MKDFRAFLLRGNVVDLAVGIVIGAAFGALVIAFTGSFITPLLGAILGNSDLKTWVFTIGGVTFPYGVFLDALITFVLVAAAIFFLVVKPMIALRERQKRGVPEDPTERPCPECLSPIPIEAKRCAFCTSEVGAAPAA